MSIDLAWEYINASLLRNAKKETLLAHRISLPIFRSTASLWMKKCCCHRMGTEKHYYNYHHDNPEVITYRKDYIATLKKLQRRMQVWKVISDDEEKNYLIKCNWSPMKDIMPVGEKFTIDDSVVFVHHIDDQEG